jgi:HK97 family phage portal protein
VLSIETVFTCVSILADQVASTPLMALKKTKDKAKVLVNPPPPLVVNPWPEGTLIDFLTQVMVSLCLRGNFYAVIADRDFYGVPTTLTPMHPDRVLARRGQDGRREYRVDGKLVNPDNMVHIPALLTPGQFVGVNPIEYARQLFAGSIASTAYGNAFFANSATPSGIITIDGDLSPEETLEMKRDWSGLHQGAGNAGSIAVMTGGAKFQQISLNPTDSQYLQVRGFTRDGILSLFRIPPHMAGVQDRSPSTTNGIEQLEMAFVRTTLGPWLSRIEQCFSKLLPKTITARFDLSDRLRGDTLQRFQAYQIARNGGWLNVDEIRDKENMPPVPGGKGQDYLQPLNMGKLGDDPLPAPKKSPSMAPPDDSGVGQDGTGGGVK